MKHKRKRTVSPLRRNPKKVLAKRRIRRARPVHKRILLHPVSILVLLCAGVLITGWTIRSFADSLTVSATVEAPAPSSPATITSPVDQTHFTSTPITVSGSCVPNSYVELYRNSSFSGVANCGAGDTSYQISTGLSLGSNDLYTRIFSITDNEGPQSSQITVFYDQPAPPPVVPSAPPAALQVTTQDDKTYHAGNVATVSPYPTITGVAPPNSKVTITFHSKVVTCITYADSNGFWSCSLDQPLEDGLHTVSITAVTPSGQVLYFPTYHMRVSSSVKPVHAISGSSQPFLIKSDYKYQAYDYGQSVSLGLSLSGGSGPYAVSVSWGDGSQSAVLRKDRSSFTISHAFKPLGGSLINYAIKVQAVDDNGTKAFLQTAAVVRGSQFGALSGRCAGSAQTANTSCGNGTPSLLARTKQWVWVIWPTYAVVVLMVFSFWLGERQELLVVLNKRPKRRR
jgi:hypothetical protein